MQRPGLSYLRKGNLSTTGATIVAFTIPIAGRLYIFSLWLWALLWILDGDLKSRFSITRIKNSHMAGLVPGSIFLVMLISMLWSTDLMSGLRLLTTQLSLILIPFFVIFSSPDLTNSKRLRDILSAFLLGLFSASVLLLVNAVIKSISVEEGQWLFNPKVGRWDNYFLHENFSFLIHPSYFGMMILTGCVILYQDIKEKSVLKPILALSVLLFLLIVLFLTSSRASIIALILVVLYNFFGARLNPIAKTAILVTMLSFTGLYVSLNPRFSHAISRFFTHSAEISGTEEGLGLRYLTWKASLKLIEKNPFLGTGIGDVQKELNEQYLQIDVDYNAENYNSHNQFLESFVAAGLLGFLSVLALFLFPFVFKPDKGRYWVNFLLILFVAFMFESMLSRLSGVGFLSFFYSLLIYPYPSREM